jgi:DnaJ like chaperone protein
MASFTKWLGAGLGWTLGGPIGGILGYVLGSFVDGFSEVDLTTTNEFVVESATRGLLLFQHMNPELWSVIFDEE